MTLYYIMLHFYITLHYVTLRHVTFFALHYITLHDITLHYITLYIYIPIITLTYVFIYIYAVVFPVAISHKVSVDTKTLRFFNPDAKDFTKMNLNTVLKMGPLGGPIFGTACTA